MEGSKFKHGEKVRKVNGYPFEGVVSSAYPDKPKCTVMHRDGWDHIFSDKQLERLPKPWPTIEIADKSIFDITLADIKINNYEAHPHIKAPVSK